MQKNSFYNFEHVCRYKGQEHSVADNTATIICEDPRVICGRKLQCPGNCNGRGVCLENGKCQCNFFYEGELCGTFKGCPDDDEGLCRALVNANMVSEETMSNDYEAAFMKYKEFMRVYHGVQVGDEGSNKGSGFNGDIGGIGDIGDIGDIDDIASEVEDEGTKEGDDQDTSQSVNDVKSAGDSGNDGNGDQEGGDIGFISDLPNGDAISNKDQESDLGIGGDDGNILDDLINDNDNDDLTPQNDPIDIDLDLNDPININPIDDESFGNGKDTKSDINTIGDIHTNGDISTNGDINTIKDDPVDDEGTNEDPENSDEKGPDNNDEDNDDIHHENHADDTRKSESITHSLLLLSLFATSLL